MGIDGMEPAVVEGPQPPLVGVVLSVQANYYWVQFDPTDLPSEADGRMSLLCTRRSRLKKIGQDVMVGDRVIVEEPDWEGNRGAIAEVYPRQSSLDRPPIANVNQILLVFAVTEPDLEPLQLSRFLIKAESTELAVQLCLNKGDLISAGDRQKWLARLHDWGYRPQIISVKAGLGLDGIRDRLKDRTTVVSGPSGVGKSSLINALIPDVELRVGAVSGKLGRGRHTTRHVELFELPTGGLLADTPGFNQPDLDCTPLELADYFPEIRQRLFEQSCQFNNCLHRNEPNCAVRGDWERYEHYLRFLEEAIAYQAVLDRSGDAESTTKVKMGRDGQYQTEPKLASKRYRRPSRRSQRQALQDAVVDADESDER